MLSFQKKLTKPFFIVLSLPATAMGFALSVQIAALSWILNTKFGFNLEEIGYVWIAGPAAGILGQVIVGLISDKVWFWGGRRRPFILVGGTIAALMLLALPNIDIIGKALGIEEMIGVAIAVALSLDLAINISFNPTRSVIADVTPRGDVRTKGYTWMQTISGFFGVVAYLIGAFVSNYILIYLGAGLVFLFSIIPTFFIEEPQKLIPEDEVIETNNTGKKTNSLAFLKICIAHAFTWVGVQTMFIYTFSYIKENIMGFATLDQLTNAQNNEIGFITGVSFAVLNTVGFLLPSLVLEPLSKRIGRVKTHMLCIAIMAMGYFLIVMFGHTQAALFGFMVVLGIGWAAVVSLPFAIMSETVDQNKMGLYMGLFNLSVVLPQLVASYLGGFIDQSENKNVIFIISAICLGISAALWLLVKDQTTEASLQNEVETAH
ncbi:MFS transporter [uncultured Roseivirga sp.]|uniref:MFS transporter n=2 Tax=Roseivirga TaxID=290180 RepID=UPI002590F62E|nr:MFS transporter [uncultured Roseivirga sp.]|tara:strand:+ start:3870 stop:5168 length:1299 start_codon:yes stop_codon:yes gene_type:complete